MIWNDKNVKLVFFFKYIYEDILWIIDSLVWVKYFFFDEDFCYSGELKDVLVSENIDQSKWFPGIKLNYAKNLIENMGGNLNFYNSKLENAVVEIKFDKTIITI